MVMARELYSLLTNIPFRLPTNQGAAAIFVRAVVTGQPVSNIPLLRTEQASIDTLFNCQKHYFLSMHNIERAKHLTRASTMHSRYQMIQPYKDGMWG
jgi:hypothetical protein